MAFPKQRPPKPIQQHGAHLREVHVDPEFAQSQIALELSDARRRKGGDLQAISEELRIRYDHLLALRELRVDVDLAQMGVAMLSDRRSGVAWRYQLIGNYRRDTVILLRQETWSVRPIVYFANSWLIPCVVGLGSRHPGGCGGRLCRCVGRG